MSPSTQRPVEPWVIHPGPQHIQTLRLSLLTPAGRCHAPLSGTLGQGSRPHVLGWGSISVPYRRHTTQQLLLSCGDGPVTTESEVISGAARSHLFSAQSWEGLAASRLILLWPLFLACLPAKLFQMLRARFERLFQTVVSALEERRGLECAQREERRDP